METKLDVKNLIISFRTNNGTVKAVRDISFKLNKGETLAIVGESGSGKSVTARAVIGILAPNAIVEGGEIIYDGKDLLKISEDDFHNIRGNRISMIFQDPMSSLNPIMRIGQQLTEAMILNGKANQRDAKKEFGQKIDLLAECMQKVLPAERRSEISKKIETFKKFTYAGIEIEKRYNQSHSAASAALADTEDALIEAVHGELKAAETAALEVVPNAAKTFNEYVVREKQPLSGLINELTEKGSTIVKSGDRDGLAKVLEQIRDILSAALKKTEPNFFTMGYYVISKPGVDVAPEDIAALNAEMRAYLDEHFMLDFLKLSAEAIQYSYKRSFEAKKQVVRELDSAMPVFEKDVLNSAECADTAKSLVKSVEDSIDRLAIIRDSLAFTFRTSIDSAIRLYFDKQKKKGVTKEELDIAKRNIARMVSRLRDWYTSQIEAGEDTDFSDNAVAMVDHLKAQASSTVNSVTRQMAKIKALELMKEVGIPEPRKRFRQYPFQFSGGMRQRIVIAIALAANPDILICDEPTTALDVTIQAQILDLINGLKRERQLSVIFITHDLGVVANMADRIAVMYAGKIVEYGTADDVFYSPAHPYTWALLSSMPDLDTKEKLEAIPGTPPNMIFPPKGDAFAARNKYAMEIDFEAQPPMFPITDTHSAATWLLHPDAPKVEPPKIVSDRIERMRNKEADGNE